MNQPIEYCAVLRAEDNNTLAARRTNEGGQAMKQALPWLTPLLLCMSFPASLAASDKGKEWLDAQKDPAAINVNGSWDSDEWGKLHLRQAEGSRDVSGNGGGYEITGVVSGKKLFMLFLTKSTVEYCAVLSADDNDTLTGTYSTRKSRFKGGLCQDAGRPMNMNRKGK